MGLAYNKAKSSPSFPKLGLWFWLNNETILTILTMAGLP